MFEPLSFRPSVLSAVGVDPAIGVDVDGLDDPLRLDPGLRGHPLDVARAGSLQEVEPHLVGRHQVRREMPDMAAWIATRRPTQSPVVDVESLVAADGHGGVEDEVRHDPTVWPRLPRRYRGIPAPSTTGGAGSTTATPRRGRGSARRAPIVRSGP